MAQSTQYGSITVTTIVSWHDATQEACEFLIAHSSDPQLVDDTYFPCVNNLAEAREWFQRNSLNAWTVREKKATIGLIAVLEPNFVNIPSGYIETCTYVDAERRGLGLSVAAWQLAEPFLREKYQGLAGATWCDNAASISRLRKSGFSFYEKVWFNSIKATERSDWCEIWLKSLK